MTKIAVVDGIISKAITNESPYGFIQDDVPVELRVTSDMYGKSISLAAEGIMILIPLDNVSLLIDLGYAFKAPNAE